MLFWRCKGCCYFGGVNAVAIVSWALLYCLFYACACTSSVFPKFIPITLSKVESKEDFIAKHVTLRVPSNRKWRFVCGWALSDLSLTNPLHAHLSARSPFPTTWRASPLALPAASPLAPSSLLPVAAWLQKRLREPRVPPEWL